MKKTKRIPYKAKENGPLYNGIFKHMRELAYDLLKNGTIDTIERAERMRDDNGLLLAAELKRKRKLERNRGN